MSTLKYCPQCGEEIPPEALFCASCGLNIREWEQTQGATQINAPMGQTIMPGNNGIPTNRVVPPITTNTINSIPATMQPGMMQRNQTAAAPPFIRQADFGDRLVAFIIDAIIIGIIGSILGSMLGIRMGMGTDMWTSSLPSIILSFLYFWLFEAYNHGQTLGKMMLKLKTINADTFGEIDEKQALLHVFGKVLFLPLDVIFGLILRESKNPKEAHMVRITQRIANTIVVKI